MGLFNKAHQQGSRLRHGRRSSQSPTASASMRVCRFEQMEPRRLLAIDIPTIQLGAVYFEDAGGEDDLADLIEITWTGGAVGTQLAELVIETDKLGDGLLIGDCFFDTRPDGLGAFGAVGLSIIDQTGIDAVDIAVDDGGTTLRIGLAGFEAGEKLLFSIDVDEQGHLGPNAVAEGNEFEGSQLTATFVADHFAAAVGSDIFLDTYDFKLDPSGLDLPHDDYVPPSDVPRPVHTAGAIFELEQTPLPITIAGSVFEDPDLDITQDPGESPLAGVQLTLYEWTGNEYIGTGKTALTDAKGDYLFKDVLPGTYQVVQTQPAGYLSVGARAGTVDGATRGVVSGTDVISGIQIDGGEDSVDNDFAEVRPAGLSGHVYHDANNNGVFDSGETGIGDVLVRVVRLTLSGPDQSILSALPPVEVSTAADGSWAVGDLMPGQYTVVEVQPDGYLDGLDAAGTAGGAAHNPGDLIDDVHLAMGQWGEDYDFGELLPVGFCGFVYVDMNNNGLMESAEAGIPGAKMILLDAAGAPTGRTTKTDDAGHYCFAELPPGTYGVAQIQPLDYYDGLDSPGTAGGIAHNPGDLIDQIRLASGQTAEQYNFGELLRANISGHVYEDNNDNGLREPGEKGIAGATLTLLDAAGKPTAITTTTDAAGFYRFDDLAPGTWGIAETQPAGYHDGLDTPGSAGGTALNPGDTITGASLAPGADGEDYNFGELRPAGIRGRVHADLDGDCTPDPGEPLLAGVTIYLLDASGGRVARTATDNNGQYAFTNLKPAVYGVEEIQPDGYLQGKTHAGTAGGIVGVDIITQVDLGPGVDAIEYDFCEMVPGSISGYVFQDGATVKLRLGEEVPDLSTIRDGKFTPDDTPIAGARLHLGDAGGTPILDAAKRPISTLTDNNGYYEFTGLRPGVYTILQEQPEGYVDGIDTAGTAGGFAINPGEKLDPGLVQTLTVDPNDDAIIGINLQTGQNAVQYNFSEVRMARIPFNPPEPPHPLPPQPTPPSPPYGEPLPMIRMIDVPVIPEVPSFYGGAMLPYGYTWHLSVINAGLPRRYEDGTDEGNNWLNPVFNPVAWTGRDMNQSLWVIADGDGVLSQQYQFGLPGATPVTGDFDGDGFAEVGVFIDGQWFIDLNGNGIWDDGDFWAKLGKDGDLPVTGDWDGDGKTDIGIFGRAWVGDPRAIAAEAGLPDSQNQPNGRYKNIPPNPDEATSGGREMQRTAEGRIRTDLVDHVFHFGTGGDRPVAGDFNGDGVSTIGIFRDGVWFLDADGDGTWSPGDMYVELGQTGDLPVVGDFNGDGIDDLGVYRAGTWLLDSNGNHELDAQDKVFELGGPDDLPVVGDFNGDGVDQIAVYKDTAPPPDYQASVEE